MLNRLFIAIGVLAILAIAAAFVVPRFIQWGDYRDRMQAIAGEVLGAPVEIAGDIQFSLLPQPQLQFADVRVGAAGAAVLEVGGVEAQFSLIDFLRDRYVITKLVLQQPELNVKIGASGEIEAGIALAEHVTTSNVSVANAEVVKGAVIVSDARSGDRVEFGSIDGELRMDALRGPFSFQGAGVYQGETYAARLGTSALDGDGATQVSLFLRPAGEGFTLTADGTFRTGAEPRFSGSMTYRRHPPALTAESGAEEAGRGDLVVTSTVEASTARILLPEYTIVPDENRGTARLTGAADVTLGPARAFNAVVSGGVLALPPRDATADQATVPYEIVRLLGEVPLPPATGLPGTVGIDIAEFDLRVASLRRIRLDATTDGAGWTIDSLSAALPGNTTVSLQGRLTKEAGEPNFTGTIKLATERLDTLSQLWRRAPDGNPLFNVPGALEARVSLVGETLSVSDGALVIDGEEHPFSAEIGFASPDRHLNLRSALGTLDARRSAELWALLPDVGGDTRFGVTFPKGRFELSAEAISIDGLPARNAAATGSWEGGVLALDEIAVEDVGGVRLRAKLTAFGTLVRPELSGTASIAVADAGAPALQRLYDAVGAPETWRDWFARSLPAELDLRIDAPSGQGGQGLSVTGRAGAADIALEAQLGLGLARALQGPMALRLDLRSDDPAALTAQLGLGATSLLPENAPMHAIAVIEGTAANSFETTVRVEGAGESLAFSGNVIATNPTALSGNGNLVVTLSDLTALADWAGMGGISLPGMEGRGRLDFEEGRVRLAEISGTSGGEDFSGQLEWARSGGRSEVTGELKVGRFEPRAMLSLLAGPAATISTEAAGFWPDGPLSLGEGARTTAGRISVAAAGSSVGGRDIATDIEFDLAWDETSTRIRDFSATVGDGRVTAELAVCCAGPLPQKQLTGRFAIEDVALSSLVPDVVADAVGAEVDAAVRFEGTGDSLLAAVSVLTGEGSYTLSDVTVRGFDPAAFGAITSLEAVLEMEPTAVTQLVIDRLDDGPFEAPSVSGEFTIAGGVLRSPNLGIAGDAARLFGTVNLRLADLGLSGGFAMSPTTSAGPEGLLTEANARIAANFGGTLFEPETAFDVAGMVDAIMVRALEIEVARLEEIRAEEEARRRAAEQERARLAAEEEAARKAAEEEAARKAAEEAARRAAEQEAEQPPVLQPGFNLEGPTLEF